MKPEHPRLLVSQASWPQIQQKRREDVALNQFLRQSENEARALLTAPPVAYQKQGRRLLSVSRRVLQRVLLLSLHYQLSGNKEFAQRAEREMLTAAAFADWNPSHFLDTAEMTAALALGYDWLFHDLSPQSRLTIREAIVAKGLRPGLSPQSPYRGWHNSTNNWNSVCMGGLALGALAIAEDEPELAEQMLALVKSKNAIGLKAYAPAGVYPEGPMYWSYGTTYQVILLAALESALGTDWGISQSPGFMQSAEAYVQTIAPSGMAFNFFDGREFSGIEPALFWYARKLNQPELLAAQWSKVDSYATNGGRNGGETSRFLPLVALWYADDARTSKPRFPLHWLGRSQNPIAIFRSRWDDPRAMFLGVKGGSASLSHGHMDAGSFVFESDGVRWAKDLGMQEYNSLESLGLNLWDAKQSGDRWKVFRLNNLSHNTLTIDGQLHRASGHAAISRFFDQPEASGAVIDFTPVFGSQVKKATRGFIFRPEEHVLIADELEGLQPDATIRWAMATDAKVSIDGKSALLEKQGQQLHLSLHSTPEAHFEVVSIEAPKESFDVPNPGVQLLIAQLKAPASGQVRIEVVLQPRSKKALSEKFLGQPLTVWPK